MIVTFAEDESKSERIIRKRKFYILFTQFVTINSRITLRESKLKYMAYKNSRKDQVDRKEYGTLNEKHREVICNFQRSKDMSKGM